jgi:hypothetical protein
MIRPTSSREWGEERNVMLSQGRRDMCWHYQAEKNSTRPSFSAIELHLWKIWHKKSFSFILVSFLPLMLVQSTDDDIFAIGQRSRPPKEEAMMTFSSVYRCLQLEYCLLNYIRRKLIFKGNREKYKDRKILNWTEPNQTITYRHSTGQVHPCQDAVDNSRLVRQKWSNTEHNTPCHQHGFFLKSLQSTLTKSNSHDSVIKSASISDEWSSTTIYSDVKSCIHWNVCNVLSPQLIMQLPPPSVTMAFPLGTALTTSWKAKVRHAQTDKSYDKL